MSSLVVSAAPYGKTEEDEHENSEIMKAKRRNNRTLKKAPEESEKKVTDLLTRIKAMTKNTDAASMEENDDDLADFIPPPAPVSAGVEKTKREDNHLMNAYNPSEKYPVQFPHLPTEAVDDDDIDNEMNYFQNQEDTANNSTPYMMAQGSPLIEGYNIGNKNFGNRTEEVGDLEKKINYVINLLEEQQDQKSDHIVEELILYCFLGVFIIFIVDSFARASKYTR